MTHLTQEHRGKDFGDFISKFHDTSNKLKKRFLRKPNVTEANEQFNTLAAECELKELWQYAGLCSLAAARCQGTLHNTICEVNLLIKAGRHFLTAEKKNHEISCPSTGKENIQNAVNCFNHSFLRCSSQPAYGPVSAGLAMELSLALGPNADGVQHMRKAVEMFPNAKAISGLVLFYIKQGDYVTALYVLNDFMENLESNFNVGTNNYTSDLLCRNEITRVFLLLILQPSPQQLAPSLAQILEKYTWVEENMNTGIYISEDVSLLLQSLVLACQVHDYQALLELEADLWPHLDSEQKELFHTLLKILALK